MQSFWKKLREMFLNTAKTVVVGTMGIKEFAEMLCGVMAVSVFLVKRFKDGVQLADFTAFWTKLTQDAEFKQVIKDAYEGYAQIPAEVKDIKAEEIAVLTGLAGTYVPEIIEAFKAEPEVVSAPEVTPEPVEPPEVQ